MARADRLQRQRKIDGYAVAAIAPVIALIPAWLIAVAAFWWVFVQFFYVSFVLFALAWFFLGGLLFVRPIQRLALLFILYKVGSLIKTSSSQLFGHVSLDGLDYSVCSIAILLWICRKTTSASSHVNTSPLFLFRLNKFSRR